HGTINGSTWTYDIPLHSGANLISFMSLPEDNSVGNVLSPLSGIAEGIIGQGQAASPNPTLGWVGSLTHINAESGYWLKVSEDVDFNVTSENISDSNMLYSLNSGANLISYPSGYSVDIIDAILDSDGFTGIIGEGIAAAPNPVLGWVGSLNEFEPNHGYWFKVNEEMDFQYQYESTDELSRSISIDDNKDYYQSTEQAFYFIEDIENIELGDMVSAYCNDTKVGSRVWDGSYTDIPAMGNDNSDLTKYYCTSSSTPTFRVEKANGETYALTGDIPLWESNGLHMLSTLQEAIILPESYSLAAAYPNPFNPTTTISFAIPADTDVSIAVYNLQGRQIASLASGSYDAGYHSVVWNADSHSSGVYFVKMVAGSYVNTQKLMLVK
ncbi:T9SS type A sorting domain-containing protein, partial [Candidatus Marinimicrobia bacterium]|nr:T9SS type A sorting domain-containing protein [Candidatus Neomarinimicrobiota bacterium]